jgi:alkylation response protein AidB-like acyl-CoA dehydrogenase
MMDILGPAGLIKFSKWAPMQGHWERAVQDCFVTTISMGTNEIQRNIIAWYGLGLPRMK